MTKEEELQEFIKAFQEQPSVKGPVKSGERKLLPDEYIDVDGLFDGSLIGGDIWVTTYKDSEFLSPIVPHAGKLTDMIIASKGEPRKYRWDSTKLVWTDQGPVQIKNPVIPNDLGVFSCGSSDGKPLSPEEQEGFLTVIDAVQPLLKEEYSKSVEIPGDSCQ